MTAQAERIRCDHCTGHYVVDVASDGSPRVRCNECGHVRQGAVAGKWTVIGPDGKAASFDTWEELTESRRPSAIAATEEASKAVKEVKPPSSQERKSASALLDITPGPKLALADMDSAIDLGEPLGGSRRSRPSLNTTMTAGSGPGSTPGGKLEPLLVKSFSQTPQSQSPSSKVEWAPKIDKSVIPPRVDDTLRTEVAPSGLAAKPNENGAVTTKAAESSEELSSSSLIDDGNDDDDEEAAPLSLRDAIQDDDEIGDHDLEEDEPDPHEKLSLRDMIVVPNTGSQPPPAQTTPSQKPPKPPTPSQAPVKAAPATSQAPPPKSVAPPAPRPKSLSRPDVRSESTKLSAPPPTIRPDLDTEEEKKPEPEKKATEKKTTVKKAAAKPAGAKEEEAPNRTWMWVAVAAVLLVGIFWRLSQNTEAPKTPETPVATTIAPPTPVTTPAMTNTEPPPATTPSASASETITVDTPPAATTATSATTAAPTVATNAPMSTPATMSSAAPAPAPAPAPAESSMSELLDQAGAAKRKGDLATARDLYGKVLAMSPNNVEANGGLGDVAKAQGDLPAAKTSYERALASSPTYSPAVLGLADVEWDSGNQAEAKRRYAQIVERMGDRAPARAKERSQ